MPRRCVAVALVLLPVLACTEPARLTEPNATSLPAAASTTTAFIPDCGFEGGAACPVIETGPRCDHGLLLDTRGTPLNVFDDRCIDHRRHLVGAEVRGSWADWALANQRALATDEPLNWVQFLTTHNANNNMADRYGREGITQDFDPNQVWSLSDQLDVGSRMLWLDLHWLGPLETSWLRGDVYLCHGGGGFLHLGCGPDERPFSYAVREIADWMAANPGEILVLDLEAYVEEHFDEVAGPLRAFFGPKLLETAEHTPGTRWPSRRELLASGKQVIVGALGGSDPESSIGDDFRGTTHSFYIDGHLSGRYIKHFEVEKTDGIVTACESNAPEFGRALNKFDNRFRVIGEDRTTYSLARPVDHEHHAGVIDPGDAADLAACGGFQVSLDMISGSRGDLADNLRPDFLEREERVPDVELQPYFVWSWRSGDRGAAGDAALLHGSDGRWSSAFPGEANRYACGRPRSETSRDVAEWTDLRGVEWRVTTRSGPWAEGGRACLEEFGGEGFVFSVPVSGLANGQLRLADVSRGDVWLHYHDIKREGDWIIDRRPMARAGADLVVECNGHGGTPVQLDGRASVDPDGDQLAYEWSGPFGTATGAQPTVLLPVGRNVVTLVVDDGFGGVSVDEVVIDVVDTTPPEIRSARATPDRLWPPNHKMTATMVTVDVHDLCDAAPVCRIVSVTSNEPANGTGDGDTAPDWKITGALTVDLRAERAGPRPGRVYTIAIECTDASGNSSATQVTVLVPHDRS